MSSWRSVHVSTNGCYGLCISMHLYAFLCIYMRSLRFSDDSHIVMILIGIYKLSIMSNNLIDFPFNNYISCKYNENYVFECILKGDRSKFQLVLMWFLLYYFIIFISYRLVIRLRTYIFVKYSEIIFQINEHCQDHE